MRVLVTGGAGYIGSVLVRELIRRGYSVTVLDLMLFGDPGIRDVVGEKGVSVVRADVRSYDTSILRGHDAVVDLAAISQPDPQGLIDEKLFYEINYYAPVRTANLSAKHDVERYVFTSTCSVYGFQERVVDESSPPNPLELYAKTKYMAEKGILSVKGATRTILRLATVYGLSPKMRFDLVVNAMTLTLFKEGKIRVGRPGEQKRPVVHVADVVEAIIKVLEAPKDVVDGEIFNVGSNDQNYRIIDLAYEIFKALGRERAIEFYGEPDTRSYIVDFTKISRVLGFRCRYRVADGTREVYKALEEGVVRDEPWTKVVSWWKKLQDEGVVKPLGITI
uniref:NAD(P)-dependent oxidoreductase n=1 Tax=Ignisphaera aggregans TaxID=334771 RepID=A0A7J2U131_9CREN